MKSPFLRIALGVLVILVGAYFLIAGVFAFTAQGRTRLEYAQLALGAVFVVGGVVLIVSAVRRGRRALTNGQNDDEMPGR